MRSRIVTFALVGFFISAHFVQASMSSTNYKIRWDTVSTGGSDTASSGSYFLHDTAEASVAGGATSSNYQLMQGYRSVAQILTFEVLAQSNSSGRGATALSGTTVTASISDISVGDFVAVIQDLGASQIAAIGKVASLGSGTITVDIWKNGGTVPVVDGINDYVYKLTGTSIAFGTLGRTSVATAIVAFEVSASNDNGYSTQLVEDGNLRSGDNEINDVTDGSVTAGVEEYGARSSDTSLSGSTFDTADTALSTSFADVATEITSAFESRNFITIKAAIDQSTVNGSYSHVVSLIASGNF